jgi:hypothetical protein
MNPAIGALDRTPNASQPARNRLNSFASCITGDFQFGAAPRMPRRGSGLRRPSPGLASGAEDVATAEALAISAVPDRDPAATLDLPGVVLTDGRRLLVDSEDRKLARSLENEKRG